MRLVIFLTLLIPISFTAQVEFEQGTTWYHEYCCAFIGYADGHIETTYEQDSVIGGLSYMVLNRNHQSWSSYDNTNWSLNEFSNELFFRAVGDSLLYLTSNGAERLYADFSSQVNDEWPLYSPYSGDSVAIARVDFVGDTLLGGDIRRYLEFSSYSDNCGYWFPSGYIIEGIGRTSNRIIPSGQTYSNCLYDDTHVVFCHVELPGATPDHAQISFCTSAPVGLEEFQKFGVIIFPNPVSKYLNIQSEQSALISLFDMNGKVVIDEFELNDQGISELDISRFGIGLYTLRLKLKESKRSLSTQIVVQ